MIQAHYEYSPFGKITTSNGAMVDDIEYRFSSEVADDETGLVYYNYRYYSPELGRWLSRDPVEEEGGINLYAMVGNDPVGGWDWLGETTVTSIDIISYYPFHVAIKYEGLPECCEINIIQWKYDVSKKSGWKMRDRLMIHSTMIIRKEILLLDGTKNILPYIIQICLA